MRWLRWVLALALLTACGSQGSIGGDAGSIGGDAAAPGSPKSSDEALADKIGELVMVGFRGTTLDGSEPILEQVRAGQVGGVVLFDVDVATGSSRNIDSPEQLKSLVAELQAAAPSPLLVAVDQEGGRVSRLKERYGFPATLSQQELGERNAVELTRSQARQTAEILADAGINLNLAPVVDLNVNQASPVIGALGRSFSANPALVADHARAVIDAHRKQGVLTAIKHFPGHGSAPGDTHLGFVDVTGTWSSAELEPYRTLVSEGNADLVMTAHVFNGRLDAEWPATLSPAAVTGVLRTELGFQGVVVSDDLQMGAIADHYGLETAVHQALAAGVDILLFANNNPRAYEPDIAPRVVALVESLVREGALAEERIDESVERVRALERRLTPPR
ncbi:MAG: glycoside hydrolase family 3 protein [Actinomycetota bacterium]|nr:glycoside hydrolase family 3 protein [Actinomycetota bacterium]